MALPILGPFGKDIYGRVSPLQYSEQQTDFALAKLCGAFGVTFDDVETIIRDTPEGFPGWSIIVDVDRAPIQFLPWLGQFVGVQVDPTLSEARQRQQIRDKQGFQRGTPQDLITRIQRWLTGNKLVMLRERDTSAYHFSVVVYTADAGVTVDYNYVDVYVDYAAYEDLYLDVGEYDVLYQAAEGVGYQIRKEIEQKPGGLMWRFGILDGQDYWIVWQDFSDYQAVYDRYATYQELFDDTPAPVPFDFQSLFWFPAYEDVLNGLQDYDVLWERETTY